MVVNLILRYEKNIYYSTLLFHILEAVVPRIFARWLTDHKVRRKRINSEKNNLDAHGPGLTRTLTRDTCCCFFRP
jgi:hypothetical protein